MSGKSYTMREMKSIVEYITENKVYGEIKARKMWIDFANSKLTNRTWQSLKETFLKRILPDIHNPYYRLSVDQVRSFKEGHDVTAKGNSKLEIYTGSDEAGHNGLNNKRDAENQHDSEKPSTSKEQDKNQAAGEELISSKIGSHDRSSVETIVLDTCDDMQQDKNSIETENETNISNEVNKTPTKPQTDIIRCSEPLTAMLQKVLQDFATDEESSDELKMHIVEDDQETTRSKSPKNIFAHNKEITGESDLLTILGDNTDDSTISSHNSKNKTTHKNHLTNNEDTELTSKIPEIEANANTIKSIKVKGSKQDETKHPNNTETSNIEKNTQNTTNTSCDTMLPNNQEALGNCDNSEIINRAVDTQETTDQNIPLSNEQMQDSEKKSDVIVAQNTHKVVVSKRLDSSENEANKTVDSQAVTKKNISVSKPRNRVESSEQAITEAKTSQDINNHNMPKTRKRQVSSEKEVSVKKKNPRQFNEKIILKENEEQVSTKPLGNREEVNNKENNIVASSNKVNEQGVEAQSTNALHKGSIRVNDNNETIHNKAQSSNEKESNNSHILNPCLQSVSLFAEQFNTTQYSDSESIENGNNKEQVNHKDENRNVCVNGVNEVILKSDSKSDGHNEGPTKINKKKSKQLLRNVERDRVLANLFGFTSGGISNKRKRRSTKRRQYHHNNSHIVDTSVSSEWTSDSDNEYVSSPRGRSKRKYLKPQSSRIFSLEEDGGLFVVDGNRIYPIVKDGNIVRNLALLPESEDEESYWKLKYVQEKKRNAELTKLLLDSKEEHRKPGDGQCTPAINERPKSPILQTTVKQSKPSPTNMGNKLQKVEEPKEPIIKDKTVKIKFTKPNEEVYLEGHWSQLHPMMTQVMQLFNKEIKPQDKDGKQKDSLQPPSKSTSRATSPYVPHEAVHERVNQIETKIFKAIEDQDREDETMEKQPYPNVTLRKRVKRKNDETIRQPSPQNSADNIQSVSERETEKTEDNLELPISLDSPGSVRKSSRSRTKPISSNESKTKTVKKKTKPNVDTNDIEEDKSEVRYMFASSNLMNVSQKKSRNSSPSVSNTQKKHSKTYTINEKLFSSPEYCSQSSKDSMQGYRDSDEGPRRLQIRKKRKLSLSTIFYRDRTRFIRNKRRKSYPNLSDDAIKESYNLPSQCSASDFLSLNSDVYKSDSYRLLMPKNNTNTFMQLEKIDENNATPSTSELDQLEIKILNTEQANSSHGYSSSVSLPMSPELSIVENISVSKNVVSNKTINESLCPDTQHTKSLSKYMISRVDVSMPLMEQECRLKESSNEISSISQFRTQEHPEKHTTVSESLLNKICTINIDETQISDTLENKLTNLLLETAKKIENNIDKENSKKSELHMGEKKKLKTRKISSTPRKRKSTRKSKNPNVDPVIEEEFSVQYSQGRRSCPPTTGIFYCDENDMVTGDGNAINDTASIASKGKSKKNVIKVKITKPQNKTSPNKSKRAGNDIDSGINEMFLLNSQIENDSIDLIHNHSETCLLAHECIENSVEFIESSPKSILSLNSTALEFSDSCYQAPNENSESVLPELFSNNAQDVLFTSNENKSSQEFQTASDHCTIFATPQSGSSINSLITEDLSDASPANKSRPSKWYLLSDEETTNTNLMSAKHDPCATVSINASLEQIFPITCAVPNLSTITEISRDPDQNSPITSSNKQYNLRSRKNF